MRTVSNLIEYILDECDYGNARERLEVWFEKSNRFRSFVSDNRDKVRRKITDSSGKKAIKEVLAELFIAYFFLLDGRFVVVYEPFNAEEGPSPDFLVTFEQSVQFVVEVTRISRAKLVDSFEKWYYELISSVKAGPSNLEYNIELTPDFSRSLLDRLLDYPQEEIKQFIEHTIQSAAEDLALETECRFSIPNFEDVLRLVLFKHSFAAEPEISAFCRLVPIAYTQKELYKIGDVLIEDEKLKQLKEGMINLLVIISDRGTLEPEELKKEMTLLYQLPRQGNKTLIRKIEKHFGTLDEFYRHMERLSGILFSSQPNKRTVVLWPNVQAARQIPTAIRNYLEQMDGLSA